MGRSRPGDDTDIGGSRGQFPTTAWSAIVGAASDDPIERKRSFAVLVSAYWKPVYKYVRVKWQKTNEDAKDITQGFFARSMEKSFFDSYEPGKARFRTFLRMCLDRYILNETKAIRRLKRGGDAKVLPLDFDLAEVELEGLTSPVPDDLDRYFDQEWARTVFGLAIESLRADCKARGKDTHFRLFERYDLESADDQNRPSYEALAREFAVSISDVTNYLAWVRREFRRQVMDCLRGLTASDEEFRSEARLLFGVDVR